MKDVFNEDYRGRWLLICEENGEYLAFIDKEPAPLPVTFSSPDELLISLRHVVDIEIAKAFEQSVGEPILLT